MAGRALERKKRRMPCEVRFEGKRHSGLIVDLSPSGLFIQTSVKAEPGAHVDLDLSVPGEAKKLRLQAEVARQRVVPAQLRTVAQGGVGVRIINAPETYYQYVMSLFEIGRDDEGVGTGAPAPGEARQGHASDAREAVEAEPTTRRAADPEIEPATASRFRVRVSQTSGPRSRRLDLVARDECEARAQALAELGEGWRILEVKPL